MLSICTLPILINESTTLALATRVDNRSILALGPSALGTGKITSEFGNLGNLSYRKNGQYHIRNRRPRLHQ